MAMDTVTRIGLLCLAAVLVLVGLVFANRGVGNSAAAGRGSGFSVEGPAWLILVVIGVGLGVYAAADPLDHFVPEAVTSSSGPTSSTASDDGDTAPPRRSRKPAPADGASPVFPPEACVVEIESPLVTALEGPSPDAAEAGRVPPGSYRVFESTMTSWAGKDFRWLRVSIPPREGWIEDSIINVASKSDACP